MIGIHKKLLLTGLLASTALMTAGCDGELEVLIGGGDLTDASCEALLGDAEQSIGAVEEACADAADNVKLLVEIRGLGDELEGVLDLISSQLAPSYQPAINVSNIVESAANKIIKRMEAIEALADSLRAESYEDVAIEVESLPISIDLGIVVEDLPKLEFDLNGEWTRTPFYIAGSLSSTVLALLNYVLAHEIDIDIAEVTDLVDNLSSSNIANFVASNDSLLTDRDKARFDKVKPSVEIMLALLAGDGTNGGLLASMDEQIEKDADQSNNLVIFGDADGDKKFGKGDSIEVPFLQAALDKAVADGEISQADADDIGDLKITNTYISRTTLEDVTKLGQDMLSDVNGSTSAPINLVDYIENAIADLRAYLEAEGETIEFQDPEAWLALRPGQAFEGNPRLRDFLPTIYAINTKANGDGTYSTIAGQLISFDGSAEKATDVVEDTEAVDWEILLECEFAATATEYEGDTVHAADSLWRDICGYTKDYEYREGYAGKSTEASHKVVYFAPASDGAHFEGSRVGPMSAAMTTMATAYDFVVIEGQTAPAAIAADGIVAQGTGDNEINVLPYVGLQDPSFSGVLYVDPTGAGSFKVADLDGFSQTLANVMLTYGTPILEAINGDEE